MPNHVTVTILAMNGYEFDFKAFNDSNVSLCQSVLPHPEGLVNGASCDWCRDNWGTKWGDYNTNAKELGGDGGPVVILKPHHGE